MIGHVQERSQFSQVHLDEGINEIVGNFVESELSTLPGNCSVLPFSWFHVDKFVMQLKLPILSYLPVINDQY